MDVISYVEIQKLKKAIENSGGNGGGGVSNQLEVPTTVERPATYLLPVTAENYLYPPLEVLKKQNTESSKTTIFEFESSDAEKFLNSEKVAFDGSLKLRTTDKIPMTFEKLDGGSAIYSLAIPFSEWKSIDKLEVE